MSSMLDGLDPWRGEPEGCWPERVRAFVRVKSSRRWTRFVLSEDDVEQVASDVILSIEMQRARGKTQDYPAAALEKRAGNRLDGAANKVIRGRTATLDDAVAIGVGAPEVATADTRRCLAFAVRHLEIAHEAQWAALVDATERDDARAADRARRQLDAVRVLLGEVWPSRAPDRSAWSRQHEENVRYRAEAIRLAICLENDSCQAADVCQRALAFQAAQDAKRAAQAERRRVEKERE